MLKKILHSGWTCVSHIHCQYSAASGHPMGCIDTIFVLIDFVFTGIQAEGLITETQLRGPSVREPL